MTDTSRMGVSMATVSRALRGLPNVAPSTRARVERAAAELSYEPDTNASRLAGGPTKAVAMIVPTFDSWYFSQVLASAEALLYELGYELLISAVTNEERRAEFINRAAQQRRFDGVIMVDLAPTEAELDTLAQAGCPAVAISHPTEALSSVYVDEVALARMAVAHLADLGDRRIALIGGQELDPFNFVVASDRQHGYELELRARGFSLDPGLVANGNFSVTGGSDAMAQLLTATDAPTAVFAMSDEMAIGAVAHLQGLGQRVPADVSVIGVDDHPMAAIMGLTTIRQQIESHGSIAARLLVDSITSAGAEPTHQELAVELVVRSSTGPLR